MAVHIGVAHLDENGEARTAEHRPVVDSHADSGERTYASFNHYIGLLSLLEVGAVIGLVATLIMWAVKRKESPFLNDHGREAVNFQISLLLYAIVGTTVIAILSIGLLVVPWIIALVVLRLIGCIRGGLAANRGEYYRYPCCIRFLG